MWGYLHLIFGKQLKLKIFHFSGSLSLKPQIPVWQLLISLLLFVWVRNTKMLLFPDLKQPSSLYTVTTGLWFTEPENSNLITQISFKRCTKTSWISPNNLPLMEHLLKTMMFWVSVPVLSLKTYFIWPSSSFSVVVRASAGVSLRA